MYVKNLLSFNKRMSALQRAIDKVSWSNGGPHNTDRYFALRSAQERLIAWAATRPVLRPVIKTPTIRPGFE